MSASWVYIDGDVALGLLGLLGVPLFVLLVVIVSTARMGARYREARREQRRRPGYIYGRR